MGRYRVIIGLEAHVQLATKSKMFCGCDARYADAPPNSHACPICMGMPGVLPVMNAKAIEYTIMAGLALHCTIPEVSRFDRKNYPYPDLVKGYQISQYDMPLAVDGWLEFDADGETRRVGIRRVHLEEDTAKLTHAVDALGNRVSLVDVNRSGVPLMEIVSEPDLRSPEEAELYLRQLRLILVYLGVTTGNLEEGAFRCDANVSLRSDAVTGEKVEIKNLNSFRAVNRALAFEVRRQGELLDAGQAIPQETRGWSEERQVTVSQRSKEYAHDYRYFPEPDLPPLTFALADVEAIRARLPELPAEREARLAQTLGLRRDDAKQIVAAPELAAYYEAVLAAGAPAQEAANWLLSELLGLLNTRGESVADTKVSPGELAALVEMRRRGAITGPGFKEALSAMVETGQGAEDVVRSRNLATLSDEGALREAVASAIQQNRQAADDFRGGKERALAALVGAVMKQTRGKADPATVNRLLREQLSAEQPIPAHGPDQSSGRPG